MEEIYGTRKQKEIHVQARAESASHREGLQKTRCQQQRSGASRMGDCKQIRSGWPEKGRRRSREKTEQIKLAQGWKKRRPAVKLVGFHSVCAPEPAKIGMTPASILIGLVSFVQPWLLLYRERCAFFLANAQLFSFVVQL